MELIMQTAEVRASWKTRQKALAILKANPYGISPLQAAIKYGCYAFTTYISDLRNSGIAIEKEPTKYLKPDNTLGTKYLYRLVANNEKS